ncbi:family 43 glycosylhydrolase [Flavobacterium johnsoniae]|uniref:Candidate beta-D-/alpha-L-glycosidase Glycoside hydrolase family 43 n=1 Tax=Flavobacterium johnsoniae (strain ATCC 17061 / DSM 2064 / JCM 8514 / BCRC 14874 / CCUG 350202 / NBRC 14942 / NCIMB 11054 / UW101) TaxID=376686 RepID=A5FFA0_FLAJ1|nr:family 43 glycosylhydrolase [Flavobacterium johnsoniae]ABQ06126.1 Candidate beta-D-/alpha-L-glycosidase; Glycoside hydrolase family 43 [Flavobacterium johnsoniae UW101]OXE98398.1 glycoside hydrolase [Flavobacterium johnsoniae UW101]WQG81872.1 family 43 glycosylhydrolase [Flavobacterium johnsoniae UW101]SHK66579.1 Glycosyl hydrolases family 43 [Flavobacterium johnsoniae]
MERLVFYFLILMTVFSPAKAQNTASGMPPVLAEKDLTAYLFVYFIGNKVEEEAVNYAVSTDGYHYYSLNNNKPVLDSKTISSTGGVRDPHILRGEDGKTFYMVLTDMTSSKGWDSNRAMVLLKSTDLVNWKSSVVNIQKAFSGNEDLKRVWAPQTIYDTKAGKYMIYFSMKHGNEPDKIYYAYANADFTALESAPKLLFVPKSKGACIDGDIILKDGVYHLFYKTESETAGIKTAVTNDLTSGNWTENDNYLQQTKEKVEGSSIFKLNNSDEYILMYDLYSKGKYQFTKTKDLENFTVIDTDISMDFKPRHGTILPITRSELKRITAKWGTPSQLSKINNNPVLEGYYADPEILYSNKTKKYYIYPTSDGFNDWSGYYFKTFSSDNLVDWKDEGIILDLKKDVSWANRNAWAPCIVEKKIKGKYQYFYYFTAAQKIGVAVSDNPTGPFKDSGKAIVAERPQGIKDGQEIDPDVFTDPKTGKSYLYWGNMYMAAAELNPDMVSLKEGSTKIIEVNKSFREGTYVIYRNGKYYFFWSEDDTRSPNYKVRYGISDSPLGPLEIPQNNIVIQGIPKQGIYATGHNSVLQIPGKDEWYIVYHRFSYPTGIKMGRAGGFHREVCIDKLEFNTEGSIKEVVATHTGIESLR